MARIAGVDIPREKRLEISLTYIYGIGKTTSQQVCDALGLDRNTKVSQLTEDEVITWCRQKLAGYYASLPAPSPEQGLSRYLAEIRKFPMLEPEDDESLVFVLDPLEGCP